MLMGQSRIFYSMSKDGLLPKVFSKVHPKYRTPAKSNFFFLVLVSLFAAFVPARVAGEMTSIGTLLAFILVCIGVIVLRKKMPDAPRAFRTPWVPVIPALGVFTCLFMMVFLPADTWIRLIVWMLIGLDVYASYGISHSKVLKARGERRPGRYVLDVTVVALSVALIFVAFWHQQTAGWTSSKRLLITALIFSVVHLIFYSSLLFKRAVINKK